MHLCICLRTEILHHESLFLQEIAAKKICQSKKLTPQNIWGMSPTQLSTDALSGSYLEEFTSPSCISDFSPTKSAIDLISTADAAAGTNEPTPDCRSLNSTVLG
ncbi:hypothetical protein D3C81_916370 [compost metagenome]